MKSSTFDWNNGRPSIFYSEAAHNAAKRLSKAMGGKALDTKGNAVVDMACRTQNAISITTPTGSQEHKAKLAKLVGKRNSARSQ